MEKVGPNPRGRFKKTGACPVNTCFLDFPLAVHSVAAAHVHSKGCFTPTHLRLSIKHLKTKAPPCNGAKGLMRPKPVPPFFLRGCPSV